MAYIKWIVSIPQSAILNLFMKTNARNLTLCIIDFKTIKKKKLMKGFDFSSCWFSVSLKSYFQSYNKEICWDIFLKVSVFSLICFYLQFYHWFFWTRFVTELSFLVLLHNSSLHQLLTPITTLTQITLRE